MDLDTDDQILRTLADGKSMDYEQWPGLLSRLIPRLEKIVHNDFPIPSTPNSQPSSSQIPSSPPAKDESSSQNSGVESSTTDKENAPPALNSTPALPSQIQILLSSITTTLTTLFTTHPPHTIQRLAELILSPRAHYRTLPSYLHAVDRVVHVTSGAHTFPLPPAIPDPASFNTSADPRNISWGNPTSTSQTSSLGSDESLGGALLSPIPWLVKANGTRNGSHSPPEVKTESTEMIDGPNGPGGIETVSVSVNGVSSATRTEAQDDVSALLRAEGGVTQGELLRQEQRAGVVPAAQLKGTEDEDEEIPHARGPEEIGMEDTGPQASSGGSERMLAGVNRQGIDIEAAVGRKAEVRKDEEMAESSGRSTPPKREADEEIGADEKRQKGEESVQDGEDIKMDIVDADGKSEDEKKTGEEGETKGADDVDATTI